MQAIFDAAVKAFVPAILPVLTTAVLAYSSFHHYPEDFTGTPWICYAIVLFAAGAGVATLIGFVLHDLGPVRTMVALFAQGAALVVTFAGVYRGYGLMQGGDFVQPIVDRWDALYFSVVTWTTLGYGDFAPPPGIRLVAAIQAILGYIFLGTFVGLMTGVLLRRIFAEALVPPQNKDADKRQ